MTGRISRDIVSNARTEVLPQLGRAREKRPRARRPTRSGTRSHLILFFAANPQGSDVLRLTEECAQIQRELKATPHRDDFRFEARWAVGAGELMSHLLELEPSIVHFSGHGGGSSGLLLQDEHGAPQLVTPHALAQVLDAVASNIRVVVLNACYSAVQAEALRATVDCVVGMDGAIGDAAARIFAAQFYGALGNRRSVGNAVELGIAALAVRQLPDELLPVAVTREGIDADDIVFEPVEAAASSASRQIEVADRQEPKPAASHPDRDPTAEPGRRQPRLLEPSEVDTVLAQARAAAWNELALLGPSRFRLGSSRVSQDRTFYLREPLGASVSKLGSLDGLRTLDLSGNRLGSEDLHGLSKLVGLTSLSLSNNQIDDRATSALVELAALTHLDLSGNNIRPQGARSLAELTGLISLWLNGNRLGDEGACALASLEQLTALSLSDNQIGEGGACALARLTGLESLDLRANRIGAKGAEALVELTGLVVLALSGNEIGDEGAQALSALVRLTSLELSANQIANDGARAIAKLGQLTSLDLSSNMVGDEGARAIASLSQLTSLELSTNQIGSVGARALAGLTALTSLALNYNHIGDPGALALAPLTGLTSLEVIGNRIGDEGARALAGLTRLTSLALHGNLIGDQGACALASLTGLTSLVLSRNRIGDEGARALSRLPRLASLALIGNQIGDRGASSLAGLTRLSCLDLSANQIGDNGARALARLTRLTALDLSFNPIGPDGARALLDTWCNFPTSTSLATLDLGGISDLESVLPPEVLASSDAQSILAAYRRYRKAKQLGGLRSLNEAKLVVVGNEAVGKTSLIRSLVHGKPRDPDEKKTPGAAIHEKIEVSRWSIHHSQVHLHVWDFGGQEIMRGTHRFFLTERSIYLLVLEDRREDDRSIYEWLEIIAQRGGDSPVIVVINKSDNDVPQRQLDEAALRRAYPAIAGFARTTCNAGAAAERSIAALREQIATTLTESPRLQHVRDPIPQSWLRVKDAVAEHARSRSVLPVRDFEQLCKDAADVDGGIITLYEQHALLSLLHDLGVVVAHGLRRDATAVWREITILDPNWLTGAIYALINSPTVRDQGGELRHSQLCDLLDPARYPSRWHELILSMMQEPELGLCLAIADGGAPRYLLPDALPVSEPDYGVWPDNSLRFRFQYSLLPIGFIPRFIVEAHRSLTDKPTWWRTGVVLGVEGCRILVRGDVARNRVEIHVAGSTGQRAALSVVRNYFDAVHRYYAKLPVKERVPLPEKPEVDVGYEHLVMLEREDGLDHAFRPEDADRKYSVRELLEGVRDDKLRTRRGHAGGSTAPTLDKLDHKITAPRSALTEPPPQASDTSRPVSSDPPPDPRDAPSGIVPALLRRMLPVLGVAAMVPAAWMYASGISRSVFWLLSATISALLMVLSEMVFRMKKKPTVGAPFFVLVGMIVIVGLMFLA